MALETRKNLTEDMVSTLQELIQINLDSQQGFDDIAEHVDDSRLVGLFQNYSAERARQAGELKSLVSLSNTQPEAEGSFSGSAHRSWIDLKAAMGGGKQMILNEAERGEDAIKSKYEEAIQTTSGSGATEVLNRHYVAVKKSHDTIRDLRDQCKNENKPR